MIETELDDVGLLGIVASWCDSVIASRPYNEVIERHSSPFIERWMIGRKIMIPTMVASRSHIPVLGAREDDRTMIPSEVENAYLHRYCRSDHEDMHCHPWRNGSLVVRGWYVEDTPDGIRTRRAGDIVLRAADQRHAIIDVEPGTLSLFVTAPKEREWGFYPQGEFVHHSEYRAWKAAHGHGDRPA